MQRVRQPLRVPRDDPRVEQRVDEIGRKRLSGMDRDRQRENQARAEKEREDGGGFADATNGRL
jgi:hypothetical protein